MTPKPLTKENRIEFDVMKAKAAKVTDHDGDWPDNVISRILLSFSQRSSTWREAVSRAPEWHVTHCTFDCGAVIGESEEHLADCPRVRLKGD